MDHPKQSQSDTTNDNDNDNDDIIQVKWKQTSPPLIQDLYCSLVHKQRSTIHAFHLWLRLLEHNLLPNVRDLTVHYHTVPSLHAEYDVVRIWLNANPDRGLNRKMRVQVLAFSLASPKSSMTTTTSSSSTSCDGGGEQEEGRKKIPWPLFLRDLRHQHDLMRDKNDLIGNYDCFIAYKQYARLYTVQSHTDPECPIIKECWVNFGAEMAQTCGLQPLWKDSNDRGPVWEFKTHFELICQLLRAFAWNVNIPYVYR